MKRFKYLKDCKEGDWVYHNAGELFQVVKSELSNTREFDLTDGIIRVMCGNDTTKVYPLTIHSKIIAEGIHNYYKEMHKKNLINGSKWVNWLSEKFDELMALDDNAPREDYREIWDSIEAKIEELEYHKSFL